jgi:hypothetical protein
VAEQEVDAGQAHNMGSNADHPTSASVPFSHPAKLCMELCGISKLGPCDDMEAIHSKAVALANTSY